MTDVTAVGIRIQNVRENGLPRQSADWLAMTKPLTEWHWSFQTGDLRLSKKSFQPKDSEGRIVGKGTVRVPFP